MMQLFTDMSGVINAIHDNHGSIIAFFRSADGNKFASRFKMRCIKDDATEVSYLYWTNVKMGSTCLKKCYHISNMMYQRKHIIRVTTFFDGTKLSSPNLNSNSNIQVVSKYYTLDDLNSGKQLNTLEFFFGEGIVPVHAPIIVKPKDYIDPHTLFSF